MSKIVIIFEFSFKAVLLYIVSVSDKGSRLFIKQNLLNSARTLATLVVGGSEMNPLV